MTFTVCYTKIFLVCFNNKKKNKSFKSGFLLPLFFWGLREASPPAQYALAFIRFLLVISS
jgi:hypothetical protein